MHIELFTSIYLIRGSRASKSQEKGSTILTGLCKTKPILLKPEMSASSVLAKDYEEKLRPANESKQSQTNPISMLRWASFSGLGELAEGM